MIDEILKNIKFTPDSIIDSINQQAGTNNQLSVKEQSDLNRYMQNLASVMTDTSIPKHERDNRMKDMLKEFEKNITNGVKGTR
jgi:tRNA C32,U32 (ribose-2'-O)-methylase TrmJ